MQTELCSNPYPLNKQKCINSQLQWMIKWICENEYKRVNDVSHALL